MIDRLVHHAEVASLGDGYHLKTATSAAYPNARLGRRAR
jgi:hypothetical protein